MKVLPFGGWENCARFGLGDMELVLTLDIGPRIIRFGFIDGPNEFAAYEKHAGMKGGSQYRSYGGHRIWVAPEIPSVTYQADNDPVLIEHGEFGPTFFSAAGVVGIKKGISVRTDERNQIWMIEHVVENQRDEAIRIAPWAITVMAPGGTCVWPQPSSRPHSEALLPVRPVALWAYTDMSDRRWSWGQKVVRLRQSKEDHPQKAGAFVDQGYAAYFNNGNVFIKRFGAAPTADYPDFGCNFEAFTRHDMLEVESLGALMVLNPGEKCVHQESWRLVRNQSLPADEEECLELLERLTCF